MAIMARFLESNNYMDYLDHIENCIYEMETYTDIGGKAGMLLLACVQKIRQNEGNWSESEKVNNDNDKVS